MLKNIFKESELCLLAPNNLLLSGLNSLNQNKNISDI